jgi:hypothetical protein
MEVNIMRASIAAAALVCLLAVSSAIAQAHYTTSETSIGTLLDDPAACAVINKHVPGFSSKPQIDMARPMTLKGIQQYDPATYTDKVLAEIDADLAQLPEKK